jgi:hypothetical protein
MEHAKAMLPFLLTAERESWHHVTGGESWFFLNISSRRMWILSRDDVVTKPRLDIQSKRIMFMIMWNPSGFYVIDKLLNDAKMNNDYFVINVFILLEYVIFPQWRVPHQKQHVVHLDNCSVHSSRASTDWLEKHGMQHRSYSPYSRNLIRSNFYLFSAVKEKLERIQVVDEDQFLSPCKRFWRLLIKKN